MFALSLLPQDSFANVFRIETRRAERAGTVHALLVIEAEHDLPHISVGGLFEKVIVTLSQTIRETDIRGWCRPGAAIGVIFTGIHSARQQDVANMLLAKVRKALTSRLSLEEVRQLRVTLHDSPRAVEEGTAAEKFVLSAR